LVNFKLKAPFVAQHLSVEALNLGKNDFFKVGQILRRESMIQESALLYRLFPP
jgi:hypothetical protein